MAEQPAYYDEESRQRIGTAVRAVEGGTFREGRGEFSRSRINGTIWLAKANANAANGTLGTFTLMKPDGASSKGAEIEDAGETVSAYVRFGECVEDQTYYLIDVCAGADAVYEVVQSASGALITDGIADEWAFAGATGPVSFTVPSIGAVTAILYRGLVIEGNVYRLHKVGDTYQVLDPTLVVVGKTLATIPNGTDGPVEIYSPTSITGTGVTLGSFNRLQGTVPTDSWVQCHFVETVEIEDPSAHQWELIGPISGGGGSTPSLAAVALADIVAGTTGNFTTSLGTLTAAVTRGMTLAGESYVLTWVENHWEVADPELAVTGTSDQFFQTGDTAGDFSVGTATLEATLSRGLVLAAKEYGLVWADGDHWAVVDPELTITGTAVNFFQAGDQADQFTVTGATVYAALSRGLVYSARDYGLVWSDDHWAVVDPSLQGTGVAAGNITQGTSGNVTVDGRPVSMHATFGDVVSANTIWWAWDDDAERFSILVQPCS